MHALIVYGMSVKVWHLRESLVSVVSQTLPGRKRFALITSAVLGICAQFPPYSWTTCNLSRTYVRVSVCQAEIVTL